jgi:5-methyltetrahydrofolate--homocysteine methyltransferase
MDGGCDLLLVETILIPKCQSSAFAIEEVKEERNLDIPIMVSGTITDASGRTLSGQTVEAFLAVSHTIVECRFNCALGADLLKPYLQTLSQTLRSTYRRIPGLPNALENTMKHQNRCKLYQRIFDDNLVNIIGGCCGTTPAHIKLIADIGSINREFRQEQCNETRCIAFEKRNPTTLNL